MAILQSSRSHAEENRSTSAARNMHPDAAIEYTRAALVESFLGRKLELADVDPIMHFAAEVWVRRYSGSFDFVISLREGLRRYGNLSPAQAKGALNCWRSDLVRQKQSEERLETARAAAAARGDHRPVETRTYEQPESVSPVVPDGTYTVVFEDGSYRTLRLRTAANRGGRQLPNGTQRIDYLSGPDNTRDFQAFGWVFGSELRVWNHYRPESAIVEAARILLADPKRVEAGRMEYAIRSNRCAICGRELTVPASIHRGIGPDCAAAL